MTGEWKPGDVAVLMTEGGERIGFRCGTEWNMGWEYAREPGQKTWSADTSAYVKPIRRLVVIDVENDEQIGRLAEAYISSNPNVALISDLVASRIRNALRKFANPRCVAVLHIGSERVECERDPGHVTDHRNDSIGQGVRWSA